MGQPFLMPFAQPLQQIGLALLIQLKYNQTSNIMAKNKKESKNEKKKSRVHKDLEGFEIKVNEHGEIISNYSIDKINDFLNQNVDDKKLMKRNAAEKAKREEEEAFHVEENEETEETDEDFVRNTNATSDEEDDKTLPKAKRKKGEDDDEED